MKFIVIRLLTNPPDPDTGRKASATEVLGDAIEEASYFEELGFDGFGIGEHHIDDAEASSPAVILGYLAASTKRIRLFTGVTVLSLLDPVRVAEDYATVDVLSGGRVDLIIGKGNTEEQSKVFGYTNDDQWERNRENYELLHRLLREECVTLERCLPPRARSVHVASPARPAADPRVARQCDVHPVDRPRRQVGRSAVLGQRVRTARAVPGARRRLPQTMGRLRARPRRRARRRRLGRSARPSRLTARHRRVPAALRHAAGVRPPTRRASHVHVARGRDRPRVVLRRQSRPGRRPAASIPRSPRATRSSTPPASAGPTIRSAAPGSNCSPPRSFPICNATFPTGSGTTGPSARTTTSPN